ncbi:MAG TPA: hypothetical protein VEY10_18425, partial [Flavisolibacter sp.]|nr:hypothetical protein [Flavisolibacter sp.]
MEPEKTVHQSSPSQIVNLKHFVIAVLLAAGIIVVASVTETSLVLIALLIPVIYAWWKWLLVKSIKLTITDQRLIVSQGVF